MEQKINEHNVSENGPIIQFLNAQLLEKLEVADNNPFIKICAPDKSIPFIVLSGGCVIVDITVNNPMTILKNTRIPIPSDKYGAGFIDIFHGNRTLGFRTIESGVFEMKWRIDDIASALQLELNLYYPGYQIRSH